MHQNQLNHKHTRESVAYVTRISMVLSTSRKCHSFRSEPCYCDSLVPAFYYFQFLVFHNYPLKVISLPVLWYDYGSDDLKHVCLFSKHYYRLNHESWLNQLAPCQLSVYHLTTSIDNICRTMDVLLSVHHTVQAMLMLIELKDIQRDTKV